MHLKPTVVLYGNWCLFIDQQMAKTIFDLSLKKNLAHKTKQNIDWYLFPLKQYIHFVGMPTLNGTF